MTDLLPYLQVLRDPVLVDMHHSGAAVSEHVDITLDQNHRRYIVRMIWPDVVAWTGITVRDSDLPKGELEIMRLLEIKLLNAYTACVAYAREFRESRKESVRLAEEA